MTAAAELGEQLNADAERSVVEIGSAELGESSSSNTDTVSMSSSIAQLFDVKPHEVTDEGLANLKKFPFVTRSVLNILKRVETNGSKKQHDPVIKATVGKLKLRYGLAVAKEVSELIGGPKKSTLKDMSKCKVPVLDYFYDKNIKAHLQNPLFFLTPFIPVCIALCPFPCCLLIIQYIVLVSEENISRICVF